MEWPNDDDVLFAPDDDWHFNACINPYRNSLGTYARSYKEAADILINATAKHEAYVDTVVYPAVFLYRQCIELTLKHMIASARELEHEGRGYPKHHNLCDLWTEAERLISKHYGDESPDELSHLGRCIDEFHSCDPASFSFRYPTDKQGNRNLMGLKHVNLRNLKETMDRIHNLLGCLASHLQHRLQMCYEMEAEMDPRG